MLLLKYMQVQLLNHEWSWKISLYEFLESGNYPSLWKEFFLREDVQTIVKEISDSLDTITKDTIVYPPINRVFRAFSICPSRIKLVVLGMDPYHNGNAVGLCFSVPSNCTINPSLKNIYNELEREGYKPNKNGDLSHWVSQGCLMLNTALTVEKGTPDTHTGIWYPFTEQLIRYIDSKDPISWLLMGAKALEFGKIISDKHRIYVTSHPSPFSAHKGFKNHPAFLGSNVFRNINADLKTKILW
jgi:uracil-DNA glycosylase